MSGNGKGRNAGLDADFSKLSIKSSKAVLPPQKPEHKGRMTVVLDMDETLLHSEFLSDVEFRQEEDRHTDTRKEPDFTLDTCGGVSVRCRPGLAFFLEKLAKEFEVIIFTAAESDYAAPVLDRIDPNNHITHRLYRESTVTFRGSFYVKDLSRLGRNLKKTVLIDNNILAMRASPDNCVLIEDFYGDPNDQELELILAICRELSSMTDIRPCLRQSLSIAERIEEMFKGDNV
jgi:RNA polymerase II subunit A small phosphatase-like protein